ncbi:transmembrane amino acid transporter protein-domain-containing protein [Mucor mucedo]|uniref:transmembrane amino acid transporter protein-domain-containing protein n=1 Tax=Mucor mucedo TaxID=29922 RepID=UPI002220DB15|nr:transmembrane amino acid transporter protein-domain-containing protein [Mucor mucedo]KAI7868218.1 transmembrane amino acid transporter protein-domain-containing protein [Mucor mucedo]
MSEDPKSEPVHIRVPLNTHPSHLNTPGTRYGTVNTGTGGEDLAGSYYYSAGGESMNSTPIQILPIDYTLTQTLSQSASHFTSLSRHTTVASVISQQFNTSQQQHDPHYTQSPIRSTFIQSIFNSIMSWLASVYWPYPWVFVVQVGSLVPSSFLLCLATNYTAKLIAKCLDYYPNSTTYGDMGAAAFGHRGRTFVSTIFVVELMTIGVAMVVLLGDGIESLFPNIDMLSIRIGSFIVLTPMLFLPIRKLAYTSLIGIISCACLVTIVLYDGISKKTKPGSLIEPMDTEIIPSVMYNVPLSFGLMMAGFAGHAVFPAIYRDMEEPKRYESMVDITYVITVGVYITMAVAGYAMFGLDTMTEITQNLAATPGYSKWINRLAIWLIVLTPLAKYGLMMNPVSVTWELWITSYANVELWCKYHGWRRSFLGAVGRILASTVVVLVATVFPGFDRVMSLLGALFSFGISAIFPLVCYLRLFGEDLGFKDKMLIYSILSVSVVMAALGTVWSFLPNNL